MKASAIILMFLGAALASPRVGMQAMHEVEANGKTAAAAPASTGGMHMGAHGHHRNISSHAPHEHPHMHPAPHWKGKHSHWHESGEHGGLGGGDDPCPPHHLAPPAPPHHGHRPGMDGPAARGHHSTSHGSSDVESSNGMEGLQGDMSARARLEEDAPRVEAGEERSSGWYPWLDDAGHGSDMEDVDDDEERSVDSWPWYDGAGPWTRRSEKGDVDDEERSVDSWPWYDGAGPWTRRSEKGAL